MRTSTQREIFAFIKRKGEATAKEIIKQIGFHPTGVFRHLKKLNEKGLIAKKGTMPKIVYYALPVPGKSKSETTNQR